MKQIGTEKTMSVKQLAETLGVSYSSIDRTIDKLMPGKKQNGVETKLTEIECTAVKLEIQKHHNLFDTEKLNNSLSELEVHLLQNKINIWRENRIKELTEQLEKAKPKIDFFDTVADCKDAVDLRKVASVLNVKSLGRNKLFAFLRESKILDSNNIPYRKYQDAGYFRVIEQAFKDGNGIVHVSFKTLVFQKGIDFIQKKLSGGI